MAQQLPDPTFTAQLFALASERSLSLLDMVPHLTKTSATAWNGPCPFCPDGGKDRFVVWPNQKPTHGGKYYCRQCGKKGDGIQFLRDCHGWAFIDARDLFFTMSKKEQPEPEPPPKPMFASPEKREEYIRRTDEYRELLAEIETAQIGYRATVRVPEMYCDTEIDFWETRLGELYGVRDRLDQEFELDPP